MYIFVNPLHLTYSTTFLHVFEFLFPHSLVLRYLTKHIFPSAFNFKHVLFSILNKLSYNYTIYFPIFRIFIFDQPFLHTFSLHFFILKYFSNNVYASA
jgi:hypothetical protein